MSTLFEIENGLKSGLKSGLKNGLILTVLVHLSSKAFTESTSSTLVPMGLVYGALGMRVTLRFAGIYTITMDTPLKESRTPCIAVNKRESERESRQRVEADNQYNSMARTVA